LASLYEEKPISVKCIKRTILYVLFLVRFSVIVFSKSKVGLQDYNLILCYKQETQFFYEFLTC